jgi:predicted urease superfamily metal-dependent hydrolase
MLAVWKFNVLTATPVNITNKYTIYMNKGCTMTLQDGGKALHIVSAWAAENRLVFEQVKTEEKSNEITAIPGLLEKLALEGSIVTIDVMGCQHKIADQVVRQKAGFIFNT